VFISPAPIAAQDAEAQLFTLSGEKTGLVRGTPAIGYVVALISQNAGSGAEMEIKRLNVLSRFHPRAVDSFKIALEGF
jgi:hypothetical protein